MLIGLICLAAAFCLGVRYLGNKKGKREHKDAKCLEISVFNRS